MKSLLFATLTCLSLLSCNKDNINTDNTPKPQIDFHQSAKTKYITVDNTKIAYRELGANTATPLIMISALGGSMDDWDPAITNALAQENKVILFDLSGVGLSEGETPDNIEDMATQTISFIKALGYKKVNLLGFSMGSFISQQILLQDKDLAEKIILTATGPKGSEGLSKLEELLASTAGLSAEETFLKFGFTSSETSQKIGKEVYKRIQLRQENRDLPLSQQSTIAELTAVLKWAQPAPEALDELSHIEQPVLIFQGEEDVPVPVINARHLAEAIPNAQLNIYKDAGHSAAFQNAADFSKKANAFLKN